MPYFSRLVRRQPVRVSTLILALAALACTVSTGSTSPTSDSSQAEVATVDTAVEQSTAQPTTQEPATEIEPPDTSGAANQPTPLPAPPAAPAANVEFSGISFYRDNQVAGGWTSEIVLAQEYTQEDIDNGAPIDWLLPSHFLFNLTDYVVTISNVQDPRLYVFPVDNYEGYNTEGPRRIADLTTLLTDKPQTFPNEIPVLPVFNAAQVFRAQTQYIAFQNGEGIRFVTGYAQSFNPIVNASLLYTFQGLTYDGKYYISLIVPLNQSDLSTYAEDVVGDDYDAFFANFETYLSTTVQNLNDADSSTFTPTLEQLDTLVNSLTVAPN